jgi:Dyp-type peroxidase family
MLVKEEIQGLVLTGYGQWPASRFRLLTIVDVAKTRVWLAREIERTTFGTDDKARANAADHCRNLAFTYEGLKLLGLPDYGLIGFEKAFREGMGAPHRSLLLGDLPGGKSDPKRWLWGAERSAPVHLLQLLYARDEPSAQSLDAAESVSTQGFLREVVDPVPTRREDKEHFGFADGVSQPAYADLDPPDDAGYAARRVPTGELLLGYRDSLGNTSLGPIIDADERGTEALPKTAEGDADFACNGAYLVCRQMRQDVRAFRSMLAALADSAAVTALLLGWDHAARSDWAASRIVGRWPSGCPVTQSPDRDDPQFMGQNGFLYEAADAKGHACPFGAHIRRANPRDSLFEPWRETTPKQADAALVDNDRRRLLRRGRVFGPPFEEAPDAERGLMFVALCASIERQFEFVQRSWLLNPNFAGLAAETDPLVGVPDTNLTLQASPFARRLPGVAAQVWTEGGGYFFLPSRAALKFLAAQ